MSRRRGLVGRALLALAVLGTTIFLAAPEAFASTNAAEAPGWTGWNYLPAWRWQSFDGIGWFHTNLGYGPASAGDAALDLIRSVFFDIAGLVWSLTLWLLRTAMTFTLPRAIGIGLDHTAAVVGGVLFSSGVAVVITVVAFLLAVFAIVVRGERSFRRVVMALLPFVLLGLVTRAAETGGPGSPSWILNGASNITNWAAGAAVQLSNKISTGSSGGVPAPSCQAYIDALHSDFLAHPPDGLSPTDASTGIALSDLWERGMYGLWAQAQFGASPAALRVACRALENHVGVPPATQAAIEAQAGMATPSAGVAGQHSADLTGISGATVAAAEQSNPFLQLWDIVTGSGEATITGGIYGPLPGEPSITQDTFAWAMCEEKGGSWVATPEFANLTYSAGGTTKTWSQMAPSECKLWWSRGEFIYNTSGKQNKILSFFTSLFGGATPNAFALDTGGAITAATSVPHTASANTFLRTWNGHNATAGLGLGFVAILVAISFLVLFGGLGLATVVAQIGLVLGLALLPILLLLLAFPASHDRTKRLMVRFVSAVAAKIVFVIILGILLLFMVIAADLLPTATVGIGAGFGLALVPLVAVFALFSLLKLFDMHHVLKPSGALRTTMAFGAGTALGDVLGTNSLKHAYNKAQRLRSRRRKATPGQAGGKQDDGPGDRRGTRSGSVYDRRHRSKPGEGASDTQTRRNGPPKAPDASGGAPAASGEDSDTAGGASDGTSTDSDLAAEENRQRNRFAKLIDPDRRRQAKNVAKLGGLTAFAVASVGLAPLVLPAGIVASAAFIARAHHMRQRQKAETETKAQDPESTAADNLAAEDKTVFGGQRTSNLPPTATAQTPPAHDDSWLPPHETVPPDSPEVSRARARAAERVSRTADVQAVGVRVRASATASPRRTENVTTGRHDGVVMPPIVSGATWTKRRSGLIVPHETTPRRQPWERMSDETRD